MLFYQKNIWIIFPFYIKETDILLYILTRIKKWRNVIVILKGKLANRNLLDEELIGISSREMKMASYPAIHQIFGVSLAIWSDCTSTSTKYISSSVYHFLSHLTDPRGFPTSSLSTHIRLINHDWEVDECPQRQSFACLARVMANLHVDEDKLQ